MRVMWRERAARGVLRLLLQEYESGNCYPGPGNKRLNSEFHRGKAEARYRYREFLHRLLSRLTSTNARDSDFLAGSVCDEPPHAADASSPNYSPFDIEQDKALVLWRFYVGPSLTDAEVPPVEAWLEETVSDALHNQHEVAWSAVIEFLESKASEAS